MRRSTRARLGALVAAATLVGLTGCAELSTPPASAGTSPPATSTAAPSAAAPATTSSRPSSSAPAAEPAGPGTALAALAGLAVKGRAPRTGYDRDLFGPGWGDPDRN